jgi:hypothetical protein
MLDADSLRNPALASLILSVLRSRSECGSSTLPRVDIVSLRPLNRSWLRFWASSTSVSDFGRPIRSSRSSARVMFRRDSRVSIIHDPTMQTMNAPSDQTVEFSTNTANPFLAFSDQHSAIS